MKNNAEMRVFLTSMAINMIISYLLGFKYKEPLIETISSAIYYQLIVFISLLLPHLVRFIDRKFRFHMLERGIQKLKRDIDENKINKLDKETIKMYEKLVNSEVKASENIKNMHNELESLKS